MIKLLQPLLKIFESLSAARTALTKPPGIFRAVIILIDLPDCICRIEVEDMEGIGKWNAVSDEPDSFLLAGGEPNLIPDHEGPGLSADAEPEGSRGTFTEFSGCCPDLERIMAAKPWSSQLRSTFG